MARRRHPQADPSAARTFLVGLLLIVAMVGTVAFALRANSGLSVGAHTQARLAFTDVGALLRGDEVRMNSIRIGRVAAIDLDQAHQSALVTIDVDGDYPIYRDAHAELKSRSGLGTKFVDIRPGNPAAGLLGDQILDMRHTHSATELDDVLGVFDPGTRQALAAGIRDLGGHAAGHGPDLQDFFATAPALLRDTATTAETLASPAAKFPDVLTNANRLSSRFTGRADHISDLVKQFDATVRSVAVDQGQPLANTLQDLPATLDSADRAFRLLDQPLGHVESALGKLRDGAAAAGRATPDVRGILRESPRPLSRVPDFRDHAEPALVDLKTTARDLRPLADKVATALDRARQPLAVLSPYHQDIARFWVDVNSAIAQGDGDKHWLRLDPLANSAYASGVVGSAVADPTMNRKPYPAPGESRKLRKTTVLGNHQ